MRNKMRNGLMAGAVALTAALGLNGFKAAPDALAAKGVCQPSRKQTAVVRTVKRAIDMKALQLRKDVPRDKDARVYVKVAVTANGTVSKVSGSLKWKGGSKSLSASDLGLKGLEGKSVVNASGVSCHISVYRRLPKVE